MYRNLVTSPPLHQSRNTAVWLSLFWIFTYALLALRSQWLDDGTPPWVHDTRLVLVTIATGFFAWTLLSIRRSGADAVRPALLLFNIAAASVTIVVVRCAMDHGTPDDATTLDRHFRWTLVWAGYFALWIGAFIETRRRSAEAIDDAAPRARMVEFVEAPSVLNDAAAAQAWDWLGETLADEMLRQPEGSREAILRAVRRRAGYRIADDLDGGAALHNARVELAERLTSRLMAERSPWRAD